MNPCLCGAGCRITDQPITVGRFEDKGQDLGETLVAFVVCVQCGWSWMTTTAPMMFEREDAA